MEIADTFTTLASIEPFAGMEERTLKSFEDHLGIRNLEKQEILFKQGDPGNCMYVLLQGHLGVQIQESDGTTLDIDELHPVVCAGEMTLLTGQVRAATVTALCDSKLASFSQQGYLRNLQKNTRTGCANSRN